MWKTAILVLVVLLFFTALFYSSPSLNNDEDFVQCLVDSDLVIYVSDTCPACTDLVNELGGYDTVEGLLVNCNEQPERCENEKQTDFVPEIQYRGEIYEGGRSMNDLADLTGCEN